MRRVSIFSYFLYTPIFWILFCKPSYSEIHSTCRFREFRCSDGSCLSTEKLCNGNEECPGGEDEKGNEQYNCNRTTLSDRCAPGEFRCRFGGCIAKNLICDGIPSCWGGTDESFELCSAKAKPKSTPPPQTISPKPRPRPSTPAYTTFYTTTKIPTTTSPTTTITTTTTTTVRTTPVPKRTTTKYIPAFTTEVITSEENEEPTRRTPKPRPSSVQGSSCPPLELVEGQRIYCYNSKFAREVDCIEDYSPEGTVADISCKDYWYPPVTGSGKSTKRCKRGKWKGGSRRFWCDLDCGNGGYKPVGFVSGSKASVRGKWPWHAGLYESDPPGSNKFKHICGATLVSLRAIITAAHCVTITQTNEPKNIGDLLVFLGKFNRTAENNDHNVQQFSITKIFVHPEYNFANLHSDIAILWLEREIETTPYAHPVCLPSPDEDLDAPIGEVGWLAGWGSIGEQIYPEELQETQLPVVSSNGCRRMHPSLHALVTTNTFCAGFDNGTSACDGDSGGGLTFQGLNNKWSILGVVSGGVQGLSGQGCDPNYYAVFTNVAKYRIWVHKIMDTAFRPTKK